jgi:hypothetical protein
MGNARFTMWGVFRVLCMKRYRGSIWYRGTKVRRREEGENMMKGIGEFEEH